MQNILVFLVEAYLKPILGNFSKIGHCEINLCNVYVELHRIDIEVKTTLKQKIIKLVRLSIAKSIGNTSFSFP